MNKIELTNKVFGRLTVLEQSNNNGIVTMWLCKCRCGNIKSIASRELRKGKTVSCGCYLKDIRGKSSIKYENRDIVNSSEYYAWTNMKTRCYNPKATRFEVHGGRGIKVCDRWLNSFANFLLDMGKRPTPKHSLDRFPDNNGDYEPSNCRWATAKEQSGNRRTNRFIEHNGIRMILMDWARLLNINETSLSDYIKRNGIEKAISHYKK